MARPGIAPVFAAYLRTSLDEPVKSAQATEPSKSVGVKRLLPVLFKAVQDLNISTIGNAPVIHSGENVLPTGKLAACRCCDC